MEKYTGEPSSNEPTVGYSCRITEEAKIKLLHLSAHVGIKRTRLASELLEAAIHEALEQVVEDFDEVNQRAYYEDMQDYEQSQSHR
jgi:hypothetical protein